MEGIVDLHHDIMAILIPIFFFVTLVLMSILEEFDEERNSKLYNITHNTF
jgi:hypothetical protein